MLWRFDLLHRIPDRKGKLTICTERRRKFPERGFRPFFMFSPRRGRGKDAALPQQGAAGVQGRRCLPCGQRRCRGADSTLFALRAKALQSGAPDHGVSREKAGFRNVFPIRKRSRRAGRRGNGLLSARDGVFPARRHLHALPMSLSPQETEICPISPSKQALPPAKLSALSVRCKRTPLQAASHRPRISRRTSSAPKPSFPRLFPPFPSPPHPPSSRRETGGLCPHPLKGPDP